MSGNILKMNKATAVISLSLFLSVVILITTTHSSSAQSTRQRLTAIEKQLNAIQRQVFTPGSRFQSGDAASAPAVGGGAISPSEGGLVADMNIRISELEMQIRQLTGQLEQAGFKVDSMIQKLETMEKDYEFRLADIERNGGSSDRNVATDIAPSIPVGPPITAGLSPKQQYDHAYGLVSSGQYDAAEISLQQFLRANPEDELAGNAQYWLGQTYYARGNYGVATRTFLEGMSKYPESPKAPAFLLKVGMSLTNLGEKQEACEVYRELDSRFPNSAENTRMRPAEERKAGCG